MTEHQKNTDLVVSYVKHVAYGVVSYIEGDEFTFTGKIKYIRNVLEETTDVYFEINQKYNEWKKPHWYSLMEKPYEKYRLKYVVSDDFRITATTVEECS